MPGCTKGCGKKRRRQSKASKKSRDKSIETEYISGLEDDLDSALTDTTEYQTLPGKSSASEVSRHGKKGRKQREYESTPRGKKSPKADRDGPKVSPSSRKTKKFPTTPESIRDDEYSERSYISTSRGKFSKKGSSRFFSSTEEDLSESAASSLTCATVNLSKFLGEETSDSEPSDDDRLDGTGCDDEECGGGPRVIIKTKHKDQSSRSESSSAETTSDGSEKCPDLCKIDPTGLPPRKPKKCDSDCRRQEWLEKQREKKQAEMDDYLLRKGFRYFDDMCKCSLKCLVSQMYVDPFIRNIAFSTVGFFLGVKLCWELDGFYVIF